MKFSIFGRFKKKLNSKGSLDRRHYENDRGNKAYEDDIEEDYLKLLERQAKSLRKQEGYNSNGERKISLSSSFNKRRQNVMSDDSHCLDDALQPSEHSSVRKLSLSSVGSARRKFEGHSEFDFEQGQELFPERRLSLK